MQDVIRETGHHAMSSDMVSYFQALKSEGKLLDPSLPGKVIADLALRASTQMSGKFVRWNSDDIEYIAF